MARNIFKGESSIYRLVSVVIALIFLGQPLAASAHSVDELQAQVEASRQQAAGLQQNVNHYAAVASELGAQIARMDAEISRVQGGIDTANAQIADLKIKMAAKKALIADYLRSDYVASGVSALEMLASSESIADFMDRRQYLDSARQKLQDALEEFEVLKTEQEKLVQQLAGEKKSLDLQKAAKDQLLAETQGSQAKYEALLAEANAQSDRAEQELFALTSGAHASLGFVGAGVGIGREGSTGNSTGCHLHFEVRVGGTAVNPYNYLGGRLDWPLSSFTVAQGFGPTSFANPWYSFHTGLDLASFCGDLVRSAAAGNIIFNGDSGDGYGHKIVIDHGGGLYSLYGHLLY